MKAAGHKTARALQNQISHERKTGALILSTLSGGYFLPSFGEKGERELRQYKQTLTARALNTLAILKPVNKALAVNEDQIQIDNMPSG